MALKILKRSHHTVGSFVHIPTAWERHAYTNNVTKCLRSVKQGVSATELPLHKCITGHRRHQTTAGYAHLDDAHLIVSVEKVGSIIAEAMNSERQILRWSFVTLA